MDRTPKFIKMCERAEEIQKEWECMVGDYYKLPHKETKLILVEVTTRNLYEYLKSNGIFLPRQDQLQEMVKGDFGTCLNDLAKFCKYVFRYNANTFMLSFSPNYGLPPSLKSFEQLWLAFVMKELYNKVWTGEEWKVTEG